MSESVYRKNADGTILQFIKSNHNEFNAIVIKQENGNSTCLGRIYTSMFE
jgi:hypothetical protein